MNSLILAVFTYTAPAFFPTLAEAVQAEETYCNGAEVTWAEPVALTSTTEGFLVRCEYEYVKPLLNAPKEFQSTDGLVELQYIEEKH